MWMMELIVNHLGNVKFEAVARGHRVMCDQPPEMKGGDQGMTPPELLLASLGTCAGYYAAEYLRTRSLPTCWCSTRTRSTCGSGTPAGERFAPEDGVLVQLSRTAPSASAHALTPCRAQLAGVCGR